MITERREMCSGIQFKLDYDGLSRRIHRAKQASGMKRAQSKLSLLGETRTFAEVLDEEVEKMVLNYIKEQGSIAGMTWELRSTQLAKLLNPATPLSVIEDLLVRYRALGSDVLHLLECLDANVLALRKIIQLHDSCFDQNLAAMYFGTSKGKFLKNTQLFPFHHQDGIRAIMSTIKRGFEDLHDAKNALEGGGMRAVCNSAGFDGGTRQIPRISFGNRLASMSNLNAMFEQPQLIASAPVRAKSMSNVFSGLRSGPQMVAQEEVSVTVLEPILQQIEATAKRVLITQHQTFVDVIAGNSEMALELSLDDLPGSPIKADLRRIPKEQRRFSAHEVGLFINLFVTFVYLANQYVVAPTSGEYARLVGMTPAMSGVIIGLCPAAALVSSLLYSAWSNHSFKQPLLACIACGILGNILYGAALQCNSANMLILGRLLTGFGGPRVISRRYIADHVPAEKRLLASSAFVTAGAMGLASGPLISSLVELSGVTFQWHAFGGNVIWYQPETAPGWIMAVLWLAALVLVIPFFVEPNEQYMRATKMRHHAESQSRMNLAALAQQESTSAHSDGRERRYGSVENLKQTELRLLQTPSRATVSPIHLTTENNNVFNLTADEMEHAIPISSASASVPVSERTRLLESHRASHSDGMHLQQPQQHQQQNQQQYQPREMGLDSVSHLSFPHTPEEEANCWEFYTADVVVILVLYVVNKVGQELVISSIPLVTQAEFSWSRQSGGYYMAAVGASVLPMILLINKFMKDVEERDLVLYLSYASLACLLVLLHCDWLGAYTLLQYIVGSALLFASLNALEGVIMALLAKLISPELAKGTFNSGLLATEAGTFGRVLGDVFITLFGGAHPHETVVNALFIPVAGMIMMSVALVWFYYDRLL